MDNLTDKSDMSNDHETVEWIFLADTRRDQTEIDRLQAEVVRLRAELASSQQLAAALSDEHEEVEKLAALASLQCKRGQSCPSNKAPRSTFGGSPGTRGPVARAMLRRLRDNAG